MAHFLDEIKDLFQRGHAEAWLKELEESGDEGVIVAHNWRTDPNVAADKVADVARRLAGVWGHGKDPVHAADAAVHDDCLCADDTKRACAAPFLAHIVRYGAFEDKILNYGGAFTGGVTEDNVETFLGNVDLSTLGGFVQGGRPIAWCTPAEELSGVLEPDALRSLLGLRWGLAARSMPREERFREETLVELRYRPGEVPETHVPTVLEGGSNPCFLPSGAASDRGVTMDLGTGETGVSEYVHREFAANLLDLVECRGRLTTDAPEGWKVKRLYEIGAV